MDQIEHDPLESVLLDLIDASTSCHDVPRVLGMRLRRLGGLGGVYGINNAGVGTSVDREAVDSTVYVLTIVASSMQVSRASAFPSRLGNADYLC
jgi:hypothetical protein